MDRISPSEGGDAGSIPARSKIAQLYLASGKSNGVAFVRNRSPDEHHDELSEAKSGSIGGTEPVRFELPARSKSSRLQGRLALYEKAVQARILVIS